MWVDYEDKQETSIENAKVEFYQYNPETSERQSLFEVLILQSALYNAWDCADADDVTVILRHWAFCDVKYPP
jgi:hypothetical protein